LASGKRYSLPNSRIMLHQPSGGAHGMASDIAIQAEELIKVRAKLNELYKRHTGQEMEVIERTVERDTFFDPHEALAFGIIDRVLDRRD
jgi:ATP-dependent Clp protease protease subunit